MFFYKKKKKKNVPVFVGYLYRGVLPS